MTYITIMLIWLADGEKAALAFNSARDCGDALSRVEEAAASMNVVVDMAQCIETVAPATSIRPKRKPEAI